MVARSPRLEGMEEGEIKELQDAAVKYAKIRDKRQKLTSDEVSLKADLLKLMKKHKKENYAYDGVEVSIVVEEETVKVKIRKEEEGDE